MALTMDQVESILSESEAAVLRLHCVGGLSSREVGSIMGISQPSVLRIKQTIRLVTSAGLALGSEGDCLQLLQLAAQSRDAKRARHLAPDA